MRQHLGTAQPLKQLLLLTLLLTLLLLLLLFLLLLVVLLRCLHCSCAPRTFKYGESSP